MKNIKTFEKYSQMNETKNTMKELEDRLEAIKKAAFVTIDGEKKELSERERNKDIEKIEDLIGEISKQKEKIYTQK